MRLCLPSSALPVLTGVVIVAALLFGGETRAGFVGDIFVQAVAVPLLLLGVAQLTDSNEAVAKNCLIATLIASSFIVAISVVQLVPLPPDLWSSLSRPPIALTEKVIPHISEDWRAVSLAPHATWVGAASLIVPFAVFLAGMLLNNSERQLIIWVFLAMGGVALVLGYLQVAQGAGSAFRFSSFKNQSEAVGFFANRNHFAALLYCTLVFAGVWIASIARSVMMPGTINTRAVLWFASALTFLIAVFVGLAMSRSRAGIMLGILASAGMVGLVMARTKSSVPSVQNGKYAPWRDLRIWFLALGSAVLAAAEFGLYRSIGRFSANSFEDARLPINWTTFEIALRSLPFGTGIGSFVPVYAASEKQMEMSAFVNRAHNDFAELLLETGILGVLCIVAFVIWFLLRSFEIWCNPNSREPASHNLIQCAATIVILLLLVHSLVDYPLRTTALSTLFGFCCGLLVPTALTASARQQNRQPPAHASIAMHKLESVEAEEMRRGLWKTNAKLPKAWQKQDHHDNRRGS